MDEVARALGLPPRDIFPARMPRYPNVWFFVPIEAALRGEYPYALRHLDCLLDKRLDLRDTFCDDVCNPGLRRLIGEPGEGCDYQARIGPLRTWAGDPHAGPGGGPAHAHQLHARFYVSPLLRAGRIRMVVRLAGQARDCFCMAASVHYEVATEEPTHPYVDTCPYCGLTGAYALAIDPASEDYCLKVHDPLGVELLLHGTIRGEAGRWPDGRPVASVDGLDGAACEEQCPGPYGCTRIARVMVGEGPP
jgi:hypothetical protein